MSPCSCAVTGWEVDAWGGWETLATSGAGCGDERKKAEDVCRVERWKRRTCTAESEREGMIEGCS